MSFNWNLNSRVLLSASSHIHGLAAKRRASANVSEYDSQKNEKSFASLLRWNVLKSVWWTAMKFGTEILMSLPGECSMYYNILLLAF